MRCLRTMLLALAGIGCASVPIEKQIRPGPALPVDAVVVFPLAFRWNEPAYRSFELAQDVVLRLLVSERFAVFGPGEFKLYRADTENPFEASDLGMVLSNRGLSSRRTLVLKPWAEKNSQVSSKVLYDARGRPVGEKRIEQTTVVVHVDLFHGDEREQIGEMWTRVELDPFAEREETDPTPEVTEALRKLTARTFADLDDAGRIATNRIRREVGFAYVWIPRESLEYEEPARGSLERFLATADVVARESTQLSRMRFFAPEFTDRTAATMAKLPGGLWVRSVDRLDEGLRPGDVVVEVAGEKALPQVLARRLRAARAGSTLRLAVRRGPDRVAVDQPVRD